MLMSMDKKSYQSSLTGAAYFFQKEAGLIRVSGPDRIDFLQRQTTGDIRKLSSTHGLLSVLTSPTARILDVLYLIASPSDKEDFIDLVALPGRGQSTAKFLKSKIFFNDNVSVVDLSHDILQLDLLGVEAGKVVQPLLGERRLDQGEVVQLEIENFPLRIINWKEGAGLGLRLIFLKEAQDTILSFLSDENLVELSAEVYDIRRIEEGLPAPGKELTEAYTPLETNLFDAVSDDKGCYTGQEVIARQITYDKVTRRLAGLTLSNIVSPGAEIRAEDRVVGTVTSSALSPRFGPIALGIIKRPFFEAKTQVSVVENENQVKAAVTDLPFRK